MKKVWVLTFTRQIMKEFFLTVNKMKIEPSKFDLSVSSDDDWPVWKYCEGENARQTPKSRVKFDKSHAKLGKIHIVSQT